MKKVLFSVFALLLAGCTFFSCFTDVGLGTIDTEAPVISISKLSSGDSELDSFEGGIYCKRNVVFSGTATDNRQVTRVYAELRWGGQESFTSIGNAVVQGTDWTFDYNFEAEGACYVRFIAEDHASNTSTKSVKTITLFVDETAPVANAWYIDREVNGIQYNLRDKETLEGLDYDRPENKFAAQNVSFTLCATATDKFGIKVIRAKIKNEAGEVIAIIENSNTSNNYAPKFKVTEDILTANTGSLYKSGQHFFQVVYDAEDITELPASNTVSEKEIELGWFVWWPEKDNPQITNPQITEDGDEFYLNAHIKDTIYFTFFDDDGLSNGYFALLTGDEADSFTIDWDAIKENPQSIIEAVTQDSSLGETSNEEARQNRTCEYTANDECEKSIILKASSIPQTMKFIGIGWDNTTAQKCVTKVVDVRVTDEASPILLIASPKNNSIPAFNADKRTTTIKGQTLDSSGCSYLEFVWVPEGIENKKQTALSWLDTITTDAAHDEFTNATGRKTVKDGMILWSVPLEEPVISNNFYTQNFSFDVDLLEDFVYNGESQKKCEKYFLVKLTRKDGNYIYSDYTLAPDDSLPVIVGVTPSVDMQVVTNAHDVTLQFYATKTSGLDIDPTGYRIELVETDGAVTVTDETDGFSNVDFNEETGFYEASVSGGEDGKLTEWSNQSKTPKFRFYARDIFGNENSAQYSIVISDLPTLQSISTTSAKQCKKGDVIDIVATFTKTVGVHGSPYIELKGIKNDTTGQTDDDLVKAYYSSGSGTTNIHFSYEVQEGDWSESLQLYDVEPINDNDSLSFISDKVTISAFTNTVNSSINSLKIDGVTPKITDRLVETSVSAIDGTYYLKEGTTLTVTLKVNKNLYISSPSPELNLVADGLASKVISLPFTKITNAGLDTTMVFSKTISSSDVNGALSYLPISYISNPESIADSYGNTIELSAGAAIDAGVYVDTSAPKTPVCTGIDEELEDNKKYKDSVSFKIAKAETDNTIRYLQYSVNGGRTWINTADGETITLTDSASFTYRAVDYAGNVSTVPDPIYLDIESSFPDFSVECINADGNYAAGKSVTLRVSFVRPVNVPASCGAQITLSGNSSSDVGGGTASLKTTTALSEVYTVDFVYTVKTTDDFILKVAASAVNLTGITDEYGISQGNKVLSQAYVRTGVHCDGIAPVVSSMVPKGETSSGSNVYSNGNKITLTFSEKVLKSSGNITLRRAGDWALPSVLTVSDFNKICNADGMTSSDKNILSLQENGADMEDSEWVNGAEIDYKNQYYHGTGQFAGPYKKQTHGITSVGKADTETKYVLDFDMGIWETTTTHYYGKTFTSSTQTSPSTPTNARTANQLRAVLEKAHYHERVLDVTSSNVVVSGNSVTITFPAGLCDDSAALPSGIEWELVLDEGCFMDETGNAFGEGSTSVVIPTSNGKSTFFSSGVATPVVRVDRYSYGLGVYQSDSSGNKSIISGDSTKPTGYVRVRIDCQTPDVTINYTNVASTLGSEQSYLSDPNDAKSYYKESADISVSTLSGKTLSSSYTKDSIFAAGNGAYDTACRQYIVAKATHSSFGTSSAGIEGIFQTVVRIVDPRQDSTNGYEIYQMNDTYDDFSIRGTTGWSGEPYISPFPLRDAQIGSPYLRLCFKGKESGNSEYQKDYFWVSFEILVDSSFSGTARDSNNTWNYIAGWGWVTPGGFCRCTGMHTWY